MRPVVFVAAAVLMIALTSVLARVAPLGPLVPDPAAVLVVYLALARRAGAGADGATALAIGYLFDLAAGEPRGLHALAAVLLFLAGRSVAARLFMVGRLAEAAFGLLASGFVGVVTLAVRGLAGQAVGGPRALGLAAGQAIATAVLSPLVFWVGRRLDRRLGPEPTPAGRIG